LPELLRPKLKVQKKIGGGQKRLGKFHRPTGLSGFLAQEWPTLNEKRLQHTSRHNLANREGLWAPVLLFDGFSHQPQGGLGQCATPCILIKMFQVRKSQKKTEEIGRPGLLSGSFSQSCNHNTENTIRIEH